MNKIQLPEHVEQMIKAIMSKLANPDAALMIVSISGAELKEAEAYTMEVRFDPVADVMTFSLGRPGR